LRFNVGQYAFSSEHRRSEREQTLKVTLGPVDGIGVMHTIEEADFSYFIRNSSDDRVDRFVDDMDGLVKSIDGDG